MNPYMSHTIIIFNLNTSITKSEALAIKSPELESNCQLSKSLPQNLKSV